MVQIKRALYTGRRIDNSSEIFHRSVFKVVITYVYNGFWNFEIRICTKVFKTQ